jgi:hypothetical protein
MTKSEKTLGFSLLLILIVIAHVLAGVFLKTQRAKQMAELDAFEADLITYSMMGSAAQLIKEEVTWVNQHTPPATSFQNAQTDLQNFLISSSKDLGFSPYAQKLITPVEEDESGAMYQRVKIQIAARATEKQIYQWLVTIHQPKKMRTLSYLKLSPPANDTNLINCQIIAEQYIAIE